MNNYKNGKAFSEESFLNLKEKYCEKTCEIIKISNYNLKKTEWLSENKNKI